MQPKSAHSKKQTWLVCRGGASALVVLGTLLPGCGNVLYTYRANSAASTLEQAQKAGAERTALYEYTLASEHLRKAMSEASEADYGDACELAQQARSYADLALKKARWRQQPPQGTPRLPETNTPSLPTTTRLEPSTGEPHIGGEHP